MHNTEMRLSDALRSELAHEAQGTRKMLERVPLEHADWKPHAKSMNMGLLASHLAELPHWGTQILTLDGFEFSRGSYKPWAAADTAELLAKFDETVAALRDALQDYPNEKLMQPWRLTADGQLLFELPRAAALRNMVMNHLVHHRAQLSVYLRMHDVPLPGLYGPSADEPM
jgi:uncharacterized damage-inducible protein DinB